MTMSELFNDSSSTDGDFYSSDDNSDEIVKTDHTNDEMLDSCKNNQHDDTDDSYVNSDDDDDDDDDDDNDDDHESFILENNALKVDKINANQHSSHSLWKNNCSLADMMKIRDKVGIKHFNKNVLGVSTKIKNDSQKEKTVVKKFKRENKHRPPEISSKVKVPFLRQVCELLMLKFFISWIIE